MFQTSNSHQTKKKKQIGNNISKLEKTTSTQISKIITPPLAPQIIACPIQQQVRLER